MAEDGEVGAVLAEEAVDLEAVEVGSGEALEEGEGAGMAVDGEILAENALHHLSMAFWYLTVDTLGIKTYLQKFALNYSSSSGGVFRVYLIRPALPIGRCSLKCRNFHSWLLLSLRLRRFRATIRFWTLSWWKSREIRFGVWRWLLQHLQVASSVLEATTSPSPSPAAPSASASSTSCHVSSTPETAVLLLLRVHFPTRKTLVS